MEIHLMFMDRNITKTDNKRKIDKLELIKIKNSLYIKGYYQESKKKSYWNRKNICKSCI